MSVFYNKKLISGVRDVPQMTLAEYNALTNKPDVWVRTDAPESDRGISASDVKYSTGVSVKDKIDEIVVDLSGYKHIEFRGTTATFSAGKATITHNLGKDNKVIPLPNGGLIPFAVLNSTQNSFEVQVVWVKTGNVADSQMATNYAGNYGINYFLVY